MGIAAAQDVQVEGDLGVVHESLKELVQQVDIKVAGPGTHVVTAIVEPRAPGQVDIPSDSRLLFDGVRVLTRLLHEARDELGAAGMSYLKRCFGLGRCPWRGLECFRAYVHSTVFAHNLMCLAHLRPKLT